MDNVKKVAAKLGLVPRLKLGRRIIKADGKAGGVQSTGPHKVKFLEEPALVMGKNFEGKQRQELKFIVEENGEKYRWMVPILNKEGEANYLIETLMNVGIGDVMILEMKKQGSRNYVEVRGEHDEESEIPDDAEDDEEIEDDEAQAELAKALAKEEIHKKLPPLNGEATGRKFKQAFGDEEDIGEPPF